MTERQHPRGGVGTVGARALLFVPLLMLACAHSEARCDHRPRSPGAANHAGEAAWYRRREEALRTVQELYAKGGRELRTEGAAGYATAFCQIHYFLTYEAGSAPPRRDPVHGGITQARGGGEFLYERLADGHWAYRCDEITRLYALANYRCGVAYASRPEEDTFASGHFCTAVRARPELVLRMASVENLSARTRELFDQAVARCYVAEGWRTATDDDPTPPRHFGLSGAWGP